MALKGLQQPGVAHCALLTGSDLFSSFISAFLLPVQWVISGGDHLNLALLLKTQEHFHPAGLWNKVGEQMPRGQGKQGEFRGQLQPRKLCWVQRGPADGHI